MGKPQILLIIIMALNLITYIDRNGKPKENRNIVEHIIYLVFFIIILTWGGFF